MSAQRHIAAEMHFEAEFGHHRCFDTAGAVSLFFIWDIDYLDMIRFVTSHHLVAADAVENRVHDGPLRRGLAPAAFSLFLRKLHDFGHAQIAMQLAVHDKDPAPHNMARL